MGYSSYNTVSAKYRSNTVYLNQTTEETFKQKHMNPQMDPKGVDVRESRDSETHPNSFPIIIALDQTGSMQQIPDYIVKHSLPNIMEKLFESGIADPQICFMAIGDCCYTEEAPLQVGQFESGDEEMEKWLTSVYLEGRGGGNDHESYPLAWYFAARHTVTDSWEKRQKKGVLITIGDEPCQSILTKEQLEKYVDDGPEKDWTASELLKKVREKWQVFHIHCDGSHYRLSRLNWNKLLGPNLICSKGRDGADIADLLVRIIVDCYKQ